MSPTGGRRRAVLGWIGVVARLVVGGVMLVAGALKVTDPDAAAAAVQAYRLLPSDLARIVGYALPPLEIALGVLLILGLFTRIAAIVSSLLLVAFMVGVASVWARGYSIDCGCFGGGGDVGPEGRARRYTGELLGDGGLLIASGLLVLAPRTPFSVDSWLSHHPIHHEHELAHESDHHDDEEQVHGEADA